VGEVDEEGGEGLMGEDGEEGEVGDVDEEGEDERTCRFMDLSSETRAESSWL
jgi:hypothetical protein